MTLARPLDQTRAIASIDPILGLTRADMDRVNALILSMAGSNVELIPEIAEHLISSGGKRLRPILTLASALAFGYRGENHVKLAASVEFLHTATLLHDDVVDESDLRRGRKTARTIWGNQASVLVGDYLLGQAFKMMVEVGSMRALAILSNASAVIAEGEVWQLSAAKQMSTTEADYMAVIGAKTAALFAAAAEVGPVIAGAGADFEAAMRDYGLHLGLAFQLVDDVLDYGGSADDLGKNVGDDFREGKITLPVILSYAAGNEDERAFWREAMENGHNDDAALARARDLLARHGALEATKARAREHGRLASQALSVLPAGPHREALDAVVAFSIERIR
ncbi:polyprenyl synthetase family protein [Aureimonas phyllosphaerae]|uniref:Octaprenyl diphosphate synthase n=1 Tax=Aureimonas phyllosphaerae TaxID=1166078 RepID=A0A7W6BTC8_9HYPH|nr:polyprenyl synthetase family protein [Aureimonas phyllosphaerae]MBB3934330.1 octaprenyl-diphosphate synthase [Aureimonas phyllosphaerae]MBB3958454.1 octaprenyl-diphosphate synthase [Aureimonas phyllosphaerae]SFE97320.1 octaprenyl-diphosphate synthase [Aureimonas phyllosphaerae]